MKKGQAMTNKPKKPGERSTASKIRKALAALKKKSLEDRIQLMVKAKLLTQEAADQARRKIAETAQNS